jgi:hypothetical protein
MKERERLEISGPPCTRAVAAGLVIASSVSGIKVQVSAAHLKIFTYMQISYI